MSFSPDSSKLAVAQSDNILFVYKLGLKWGEKKSICNKFPQTSNVTCMCWPSNHQNELYMGLGDGKVKQGILNKNKSVAIYSAEDPTVSICSKSDGTSLVAGHSDGSIYIFSVASTGAVTKVIPANQILTNTVVKTGTTSLCPFLFILGRKYCGCRE